MDRESIVLAALSTAAGKHFEPVQVQKFFFLIDQEVGARLGGPFFEFKPYNYGPFDGALYTELSALASIGLVSVHVKNGSWRCYGLTEAGQRRGEAAMESLHPEIREYLNQLSAFVRSLTFEQLVAVIYERYPDMKRNSIFRT